MKKKILVVEDELDMLDTVASFLRSNGYEVFTAEDGEKAVKLFHAEKPDLVVLDIILPKMDGWKVCHEMKKDPQLSMIPVIMLSALIQEEGKSSSPLEKADLYLAKPFRLEKLMDAIQDLIKN